MESYNKQIIPRLDYTQKLEAWANSPDLVKIITGVRRCGKSTLFKLFQERLIKNRGVLPDQIIDINLEILPQTESIGLKYNKKNFLTNYSVLHDYILETINKKKMNYVFIDEIQLLENWHIVANSLRLHENIDLYLTGSNAYMYSWDLANSFGGRYIEIKIQPFSFKEYCSAYLQINAQQDSVKKEKLSSSDLFELYNNYINDSGFPQTIKFKHNERLVSDYLLNTVYLNTVQKDIVKRYNIKETNKLDAVIKYMFDNIGNETSINNIVKGLKKSDNSISAPSVDNYIKGLLDSYLIYKCDRYDIKGRRYLESNSKYYVVDVGLRATLLGKSTDKDAGHILENIVYLELLRRGYNVRVGKLSQVVRENNKDVRKTVEIDFVAEKMGDIEYYQVALNTLDPDVLTRELAPLEKIKDNYPKYLLTLDYGSSNNNGIKRLNVLDWLLENLFQ